MTAVDIDEYVKIVAEVDEQISAIVDEYTVGLEKLKDEKKTTRLRVLVAFSFLEVMTNVYNIYFGLNLTNSRVIKEWLNRYCLFRGNSTFNENKYLRKISAEHMYKLRNSTVHAFALPEPESGLSILLINGDELDKSIDKMHKGFKDRGADVTFVAPSSLLKLFLDGYLLMHSEIYKPEAEITTVEFESMSRLREEFHRRGAKTIDLN